jgi:IclR family acetate operon transcriptional repressor
VGIAAETGLHKNTAFSLLKTLVALGYCEQTRDQGYRIGRRTFELARVAERNLDLVTAVRPLMLRLVWQVRESLSLAIPASDHCVVVSTVEGSYAVRGSRFHGQHAPYHASAVGKAVVASLADEDRAQLIKRITFERYTGRTITSPVLLEEECARVREKGFAVSVAEEEVGASAVAVPLFSRAGDVVGALALWGPSARLPGQRWPSMGKHLGASAWLFWAERLFLLGSSPTISDAALFFLDHRRRSFMLSRNKRRSTRRGIPLTERQPCA